MEAIKIGITEATPMSDPLGGAGGTCALSIGSIWKPVDYRGGISKSKL
ncbi:hypothetical protein CNEO3_1220003 [Clostridium neonatale]|nr:hypothetical protein CNEO3_1220003 [Clostridium neonatale]CAI3641250.1 hypothetical protein CNEO3_70118 [Clostridium neonatale]